jgi:cob(I)alamin adenosyltransferase
MKDWKIYTKTGDMGETSLLGGKRVPKHHLKIEAYGTADELNAFIGLLRDQDLDANQKDFLFHIQDRVFVAESLLAADEGSEAFQLPQLHNDDVLALEREIDLMNACLPALRNFILPGGYPAVSYAHVCRVVSRRAERIIINLAESFPVPEIVIMYFNRLSDYFFVLARKIAFDKGVDELLWRPGK